MTDAADSGRPFSCTSTHFRRSSAPPGTTEAARRWGVNRGDVVVAYDDVHSVAAARAWWTLTRSGLPDVRVLDGGLRGWLAERLPLDTGDVLPRRGDVVLQQIDHGVADIDEVEEWPWKGVLLDVRAPERYRGDAEPLDPVAGHIPGAVNLPTTDAIRAEFAAAGVVDGVAVAAYCGSGIAATHTALAGAIAGIEVTVYPGSWSQWSNSRGRGRCRSWSRRHGCVRRSTSRRGETPGEGTDAPLRGVGLDSSTC